MGGRTGRRSAGRSRRTNWRISTRSRKGDAMSWQPQVTGRRYMVSAGHWLAAEAALRVLEAGGNAVDAGVAGGIAPGVVHSDQVQVSGVAPIILYRAESRSAEHTSELQPLMRIPYA